MSVLNPRITLDTNGNLTLRWTPDPQAKGYILTTPTGSSTAGAKKTSANLGKHTSISVTIAALYSQTAETASYPAVTPPPPPSGNVIFQADYNIHGWEVWDDVAMLNAAKSLVPDPAGSGLRVAKLVVAPPLTGGEGYCEPVKLRDNGLDLGLTVLVEQELYVDPATAWTNSTSWNNLHQTKIQSPGIYGGSLCVQPSHPDGPHFVYRLRDASTNDGPDAADLDLGPVVTGRWISFAWTAKWSDGADGFVAPVRDGVALPVYHGPTTTAVGSPNGRDGKGVWRKLTQGLYCGPSLSGPQVVYFKGIKVSAAA